MAKSNLTISVSLFLSVLLVGCAAKPTIWDKPGATQEAFSRDKYQCLQETADSGNYTAVGPLMFIAIAHDQAMKRQQAMFNACMEAHGYVAEAK
jgi:hypothetical protein